MNELTNGWTAGWTGKWIKLEVNPPTTTIPLLNYIKHNLPSLAHSCPPYSLSCYLFYLLTLTHNKGSSKTKQVEHNRLEAAKDRENVPCDSIYQRQSGASVEPIRRLIGEGRQGEMGTRRERRGRKGREKGRKGEGRRIGIPAD